MDMEDLTPQQQLRLKAWLVSDAADFMAEGRLSLKEVLDFSKPYMEDLSPEERHSLYEIFIRALEIRRDQHPV